ncbi:hypothetical protein AAMO2058_001309400 [Amorphochlora amoebiformis]
MSAEGSGKQKGEFVGTVKQLEDAKGMLRVEKSTRHLLVLLHDKKIYALDGRCFHAGAPLQMGDIEDFDGHTCIKCPWHSYRIDIKTGDHIQAVYSADRTKRKVRINAKCQRTHRVQLDKNGNIFVTIESLDTRMKSDEYAMISEKSPPKIITLSF